MTNKPSRMIFQIIESNISTLYSRLRVSLNSILKMVEKENDFQEFYNSKKDEIIETQNLEEFIKFQSLMKGLYNIIYYNSLILSSYSIFEHSLKQICIFINTHYVSEEFTDTHRNILKNCTKYIKNSELINANNKELNILYQNICKVNKLRNLIAHNNGNIYKDISKSIEKQDDYNTFKLDNRLTILDNGQVYINDDEYIRSFIRESERFLNLIIKQLKSTTPNI